MARLTLLRVRTLAVAMAVWFVAGAARAEPVRVEWQSDDSCAKAERFSTLLLSRATVLRRAAPTELARVVRVRVEPALGDEVSGSFDVQLADGTRVHARATGACDNVVSALAVLAAHTLGSATDGLDANPYRTGVVAPETDVDLEPNPYRNWRGPIAPQNPYRVRSEPGATPNPYRDYPIEPNPYRPAPRGPAGAIAPTSPYRTR